MDEELRHLGVDMMDTYKDENVAKAIKDAGVVNMVIELVSTTLQTSIDACTDDGRVVLIGNLGGQQATVDTQAWRLKRVVVIGGGMLRTSTENEQRILQLIAEKAVTPIVAHTMPVEQAAEAHHLL